MRSLPRPALAVLLAAASSALAGPPAFEPASPPLDRGPLPLEVQAVRVAGERLPLSDGARLRLAAGRRVGGGTGRLLTLREELDGLLVFRGEHRLALDGEGRLRALIPGASAVPGRPGPFLIDAAGAALLADAALAGEEPPSRAFATGSAPAGTPEGEWTPVELASLDEPAWARRVVLPEGPTSAWQVELPARHDRAERWMLFIDATAGTELRRIYRSQHAAAQGRVFPRGATRPSELVDFVDGDLVLDPASPAGWLDADRTEGNNCYAWDDRAADGGGTEGLHAYGAGEPLLFDFPVSGVPQDDLEAALTNAFWAVNFAHDRFWQWGFDEAGGNGQRENFGRGGVGGDRTRVSVQYRAGEPAVGAYNNATTYTNRGDGSYNQIILGLWDRSGELRDGALDTGLIFHEFGHLAALRSLGPDSACDDGVQADALHEGWGDYFAAALTGDTVIGAWVSGDLEKGLRTRPIDDNNYTYLNLCNISRPACRDTENGEIWAGALWDLRERLVAAWGPEEGALRANRLVVEGLQLTACPPTFLDARDGLLLADILLQDGQDRCRIWAAMAGRGMGLSAETWGTDDDLPSPGFDQPAECSGGASLSWLRPSWGDDAEAELLLSGAGLEGLERRLELTSSSGDSEALISPPGPGARRLTVPLRPGAPVPGDGILQVADGDVLGATCTDCPGAPADEASVRRAVDVFVREIDFRSQTCDDDADPDFDQPPMLDAGEFGIFEVLFANAETFPLEDVRVRATCDHPGIDFLPRGELAIGDVRARTGIGWPFEVEYPLRADPSIAFGEAATFTFELIARGHQATTQVTIPLAADYRKLTAQTSWGGTETFEPSSPSVADWVHEPAGGRPADQWSLQDCGDGQGRAMLYGGPGCTEYSDEPAAARLVSPPLFPGGLAVVEPTSVSWRNRVDLGRDEATLYCDADAVILYLTDDPDRPNFELPRGDRGGAVQWWAQLTAFSDERNTDGWVDAGPQQVIDERDVRGMDLSQVRLWWYFFTDVYSPVDSSGCRSGRPDAVGLGYAVDDVTVTWDGLERIPQDPARPCDAPACFTRAHLLIEGPELPCPGEDLLLDGSFNEALDCPNGLVEHRFTGPGFDSGWGPETSAVAPAADGNFRSRVRCVEDTSCADTETIRVTTLDASQAGRVARGSLRVRRQGEDLRLGWTGTRSPEAHAVFRADADAGERTAVLAELALNPPPDTLRAGSPWGREHLDAGAAADGVGLAFYRVFGRDPCSGEAADR